MDESADVVVHQSAFPGEMKEDLSEGLRARRLDSRFLYLGLRQTLRWLALHEAWSPARTDAGVKGIYEECFAHAGEISKANLLHLVGLAPGGGQKETRGIEILREQGRTVFFTPCDVSVEMALAAHEEACGRVRGLQSHPVVCDLGRCTTMPRLLKTVDPGGTDRLVTFFGTIHNFEPAEILPRILNVVRSQDLLLLGANLLPEANYDAAFASILPQYRNELTAEWMLGPLEDIGITRGNGELTIEPAAADPETLPGIKRVEAHFTFGNPCEAKVFGQTIAFAAGEKLRLFFSYRYTAGLLEKVLASHGLSVERSWIAPGDEEGVFLCRRVSEKPS